MVKGKINLIGKLRRFRTSKSNYSFFTHFLDVRGVLMAIQKYGMTI